MTKRANCPYLCLWTDGLTWLNQQKLPETGNTGEFLWGPFVPNGTLRPQVSEFMNGSNGARYRGCFNAIKTESPKDGFLPGKLEDITCSIVHSASENCAVHPVPHVSHTLKYISHRQTPRQKHHRVNRCSSRAATIHQCIGESWYFPHNSKIDIWARYCCYINKFVKSLSLLFLT